MLDLQRQRRPHAPPRHFPRNRRSLDSGRTPQRLWLVIAGEPQVTTAGHPRGALLRAYDKATGKEIGGVFMPAQATGAPMTYMVNGRQYIVIAIGGGGFPAELIAFRLPA